ncbi:MAG: hypothetical protein WBF28_01670, partial [Atribacterota bacterium]
APNFFTVAGTSSPATNAVNSGVVTAVFPETLTVIDIKAITGVTAPVIAEIPVGTITETAQYIGTVTWAPTNNPFAGRTAYTATINLTPKAGFNLTGVATNFFTVAGTSSPATNAVNSGVVTAVFPVTANVAVGDSCGGGKVAYILQIGDLGYDANKQHGLIAATADQVSAWSNLILDWIDTTEQAIGTGQANTTAIVGQAGCSSGAAYYCDNLTEGVYNDWFLPSLGELIKLFDNKSVIGGFGNFPYWSSSEAGANNAWYLDFGSGDGANLPKGNPFPFRAVRDF